MTNIAKIEQIYYDALDKTPREREMFLREVCGNDGELRREVESLLSFDNKAADFIESPPNDLAASLFNPVGNKDLIGKKINHYQVISLIDKGGMGEVYLAEDMKLGRKVALKLLPAQFSINSDRKKRFEREARTASALNHPNIITIYGSENYDEYEFIVTEFIDGQTLSERLANDDLLPVVETLGIGIQIASALEAVHSVGIIHRDIKPANIMLRGDRIVKILDFGLAKMTASIEQKTKGRIQTKAGMILGTINYMSPEQALGEKLDARTDIFSLGVVLYEMLTGIKPFNGSSEAAIYNSILNKEAAPLDELKPDLKEVISRAMKKNAAERFQTAADLRVALENVRQRLYSGEPAVVSRPFKPKSKTYRNKIAIAAAVTAVFLAIIFLMLFSQSRQGAAPIKNVNYTQLTKLTGAEMYPSLSPDGKTFLFSSRSGDKWDVFYQRVGGANPVNLTKYTEADDLQAAYSPDGEQIVFHSDRDGGGIFLMGATGENVRRVTDSGFYPSWSPDGKEIVFSTENFEEPMNRGIISFLWTINIATGEKRKLTEQDSIQPSWSPTGARIAFWGYNPGDAQRDIWTISADGTMPARVTDDAAVDWNPVWSPDGKYLYFASDRGGSMNLWRISIDEETGAVSGEPEPIPTPSTYAQHFNFSRDGRNFAYVQSVNYSNILKADFDLLDEKTVIKNSAAITQNSMWATNSEPSSDGEWIVFDNIGDKQEDIFLIKPDGTELRQLTNDIYKDRAPRLSPDGKQIAFFSDRSGKYQGWIINTDGSNLRQATDFPEGLWAQTPVWSSDGKKLLVNRNFALPQIFDASAPPANQTPETLTVENAPENWVMMSSWSPNGKKLAGYIVSNGSGISGIIVYSFDTRRYEKVTDFGTRPVWMSDNRRLIFYSKDKIYMLDSRTKNLTEILSVAPNRLQNVAISKDNSTIFYSRQKTEADIWLGTLE